LKKLLRDRTRQYEAVERPNKLSTAAKPLKFADVPSAVGFVSRLAADYYNNCSMRALLYDRRFSAGFLSSDDQIIKRFAHRLVQGTVKIGLLSKAFETAGGIQPATQEADTDEPPQATPAPAKKPAESTECLKCTLIQPRVGTTTPGAMNPSYPITHDVLMIEGPSGTHFVHIVGPGQVLVGAGLEHLLPPKYHGLLVPLSVLVHGLPGGCEQNVVRVAHYSHLRL